MRGTEEDSRLRKKDRTYPAPINTKKEKEKRLKKENASLSPLQKTLNDLSFCLQNKEHSSSKRKKANSRDKEANSFLVWERGAPAELGKKQRSLSVSSSLAIDSPSAVFSSLFF
jgi:myosin heavy subunit